MDLIAGVRKEGSRGGRADFKWEDVKDDAHRENYLGHSLKAPVGRWQKNRDLSWYAKADGNDGISAEEARREEIRRIKEAEQDALSAALGFAVEPRRRGADDSRVVEEVKKAVKETAAGDSEDEGEGGRGVGFGGGVAGRMGDATGEVLGGAGEGEEGGLRGGREKERGGESMREREKEERHREREKNHRGHRERRRRSRTPDRDWDRRRYHQRRSHNRSPNHPRRRHTSRSRSRSPGRPRRRHTSYSPRPRSPHRPHHYDSYR
ncbi:MAG: hypothetical protein M1840_008721 [Geoglossum simile]|nr:MAG: hypothetical protein M1840_008721 [Geoglossum simile]